MWIGKKERVLSKPRILNKNKCIIYIYMNENNQLENETSILTYKNVCGRNSFETALRVSLKLCTCRIVMHI